MYDVLVTVFQSYISLIQAKMLLNYLLTLLNFNPILVLFKPQNFHILKHLVKISILY